MESANVNVVATVMAVPVLNAEIWRTVNANHDLNHLCSAFGKKCKNSVQLNHFSSACRRPPVQHQDQRDNQQTQGGYKSTPSMLIDRDSPLCVPETIPLCPESTFRLYTVTTARHEFKGFVERTFGTLRQHGSLISNRLKTTHYVLPVHVEPRCVCVKT